VEKLDLRQSKSISTGLGTILAKFSDFVCSLK
jgi:hypothetical protein